MNQDSNQAEELRETGEVENKDGIKVINIIGQIEGHNELPPQSKTT